MSYSGTHPLTNWAIPGQLLIGAYPLEFIEEIASECDTIVCLMEESDADNFGQYISIMNGLAGTEFIHLPIPDRSVVDDATLIQYASKVIRRLRKGKRVYVHCLGGKGRTGTLVGVVLGLFYNLSSTKALQCLRLGFSQRVDKGTRAPRIPQTRAQIQQIRRILDQA